MNKRGITLDIESADGRELFKKLAAKSDFILESFKPGYIDSLGLGYEALSADNPGLIMTSMTPFGQTGPYAHFKATDIVAWSMGGQQYASGDDDRPPVRVSFPQAELHGGAQGAAGTMTALWQRTKSGEGQQVDVSMQTSVIWTLMNATHHPPIMGNNMERAGGARKRERPYSQGYLPMPGRLRRGQHRGRRRRWQGHHRARPDPVDGRGRRQAGLHERRGLQQVQRH